MDNPTSSAQDTGKNVTDQIQQGVEKAKDNIQQTMSQVGSEAQKTVENVQQTVTQVSTEAWRNVAEANRSMRESAYTVKDTASDSLLKAAENIRREAVKGGNDEVIRQAHRLARGMEKAAVYLDSHTFEQIGSEAAETVKENPWQSLGIAFIIGLILGLLLNSGRD